MSQDQAVSTAGGPAVIGVQSCGCITFAHADPERHWDRDDEKAVARIIREGGQVIRTTVEEAKAMPHFLVAECPHDPKGWEPDPPPRTDVHVKSFKRVRHRDVSRPSFANVRAERTCWDRFQFGEVRKWDGKWWATDGWFNHGEAGAHKGMLAYEEGNRDDDRPTLHLGPFDTQREAADALIPYVVEYAAKLAASWAEQRRRGEAA